jgi:hypothetical protein
MTAADAPLPPVSKSPVAPRSTSQRFFGGARAGGSSALWQAAKSTAQLRRARVTKL